MLRGYLVVEDIDDMGADLTGEVGPDCGIMVMRMLLRIDLFKLLTCVFRFS